MSAQKPEHLIKYLDGNAAQAVLASRCLRWSSPNLFADPFETDGTSQLPFEIKTLLDSTIKLASSMIFAPEQPKGDSPLINAIKRWREEGRFATAEEAHGVLRELLGKMVDHRISQLEGALRQWQEHVRNIRICCFSGKPDIPAAWEKFGAKHTGIALRFDFTRAPFSEARPVIYQSERPQITSIREQLGAILHNKPDTVVARFNDLHLLKSSANKAEDEWRCLQKSPCRVSIDDHRSDQWFDALPFAPEALTGVYFGLRCDEATRKSVTELLKEGFSHVKTHTAVLGKTSYTVEFEKIAK